MNRSPQHRLIALLIVLLLATGACSSGSDDADASDDDGSSDDGSSGAEDEVSNDADEQQEEATTALSCEEVGEPSGVIRGANGWLGQIGDAEADELLGGDYDAVLAAIETLRPIQDIEGSFGTMREGLDNMETDIIAVQEGRYTDKVGDYGITTMNAVVVVEICGG